MSSLCKYANNKFHEIKSVLTAEHKHSIALHIYRYILETAIVA